MSKKNNEEQEEKKDNTKYWALGGAIIMLGLLILSLFVGTRPKDPGQYDALVECIAEKEVKMYGAYWCSHCNNQKDALGTSWDKMLELGVYVECDPKGDNSQSQLCLERGIEGYPTWHIPDTVNESVTWVVPGEINFYDLAERSGCLDTLGDNN